MGSPEELPNITAFPLSPRVSGIPSAPPPPPHRGAVRPLSPTQRAKVEFWNHGEQAGEEPMKKPQRNQGRLHYSKRADRLGIIMGVVAVLLLGMVMILLKLGMKETESSDSTKRTITSPVVDFYLGNRVFNEKVRKEKSSDVPKEVSSAGANDDFEISLQSQMASMDEKLKLMREQKEAEEPPLPVKDTYVAPILKASIQRTDEKNFNSPVEFNQELPKPLQQIQ